MTCNQGSEPEKSRVFGLGVNFEFSDPKPEPELENPQKIRNPKNRLFSGSDP